MEWARQNGRSFRWSAAAGAAVLCLAVAMALAACSTRSASSGVPTPGGSTAPKAVSCTPNGSAIPDGHYSGKVDYIITTTLTISADGISISNAGGGKEHWQGVVDLVSRGGKVTGTMNLDELGISQVGLDGSVQFHSVENSGFTGTISGQATAPVVTGTGTGTWSTEGGPESSATSSLTGGLHITKADCTSITGDAAAMFTDFLRPVAQYLSVTAPATWVATRH